MLENIFKMYSTEIARRMARILKITQDPEQYGFTEGKSCMEPTRTIIDTILHANQNNQPLIVLSTDLYKAFDTISLDHIERSMDFLEFPAKYKNAFMRLARNGTLQFEINGHLSEDFHLNRGTGQTKRLQTRFTEDNLYHGTWTILSSCHLSEPRLYPVNMGRNHSDSRLEE